MFTDFNDGISFWYGAELDPVARELYALVLWTDSTYERTGTVVAWNLDTKDRRVVTGIFPHSRTGYETFGSGYVSPDSHVVATTGTQPLTQADVIRLASDGNLYVSSRHEIVRVDPQTGARELVWRAQDEALTGDISATYGQCFRPDRRGVRDALALEFVSFEVGPSLEFYRAFRDGRGGNGIVRISPDGKTCTPIARWGDRGDPDPSGSGTSVPPKPDIGSGVELQRDFVQGMHYREGKLYAVVKGGLFSFDVATGRRARIDDPDVGGEVGYTSMSWDSTREVLWASGVESAVFGNVVVDLETGQKELIATDTGLRNYPGSEILRSVYPGGGSAANTGGGATSNNNKTNLGGVVLDPTNPDIAYGVTTVGDLLKLELSTFNNYIHSHGQY